mgnify:CR=1 FL=1
MREIKMLDVDHKDMEKGVDTKAYALRSKRRRLERDFPTGELEMREQIVLDESALQAI